MSKAATIILPHQLFKDHPALDHQRQVHLVEEHLFFQQYPFHKKKLILHRASMKSYAAMLEGQGYEVRYTDAHDETSDIRRLIPKLAKEGVGTIYVVDPVDDWVLRRLKKACVEQEVELVVYDSPNFLNRPADLESYFKRRKTYFQADFYAAQRKQRRILLEPNGGPMGGKWSFDADNRKKFPKGSPVPELPVCKESVHLKEAMKYVAEKFPHNPGTIDGADLFAISHADAESWLYDFLEHRFRDFGVYEDAMVAKESVLHHSVLTPMLNIGLLDPQQVIDGALDAAARHDIPMNSLEGFIRQVMGWREFVRIVYEREGRKQRTRNFWAFTRKVPSSFYTGDTGIGPVDVTIKRILKTGYCHHIERLMVLGNFMLLCEFDPNDVYRWFMELFIDAYDWVMVPNVYGMSQYADGGLMTTKPYISGSNYIMKMSDHAKGDWQTTWDGLFWRFLHVHREVFKGNPRWSMLIKTFDNMDPAKRDAHLRHAETYLRTIS